MKYRNLSTRRVVGTLYVAFSLIVLALVFNNCSDGFKTTGGTDLDSSGLDTPGPTPTPAPPPAPAPTPTPTPTPMPPPAPTPMPTTPTSACVQSSMRKVSVNSVSTLSAAISAAVPGDSIEIQPGTYRVNSAIGLNASGTTALPICLRAAQEDTVVIESASTGYMAFRLQGANWVIENLTIKGVCSTDSLCEHAIQIKENAHNAVIRNNTMVDFNAQIKGQQSNNVVIEGNHFYDTRPRQTSNPVTKIDVVGGKYWVVRGNLIHDFQKAQGDGISYAAFLKGYSMYGTFENNVVACSLNHAGATRIGLSFGGGGTGAQFCWDYNAATGKGCAYEHEFGMMRNNVILNCSDVGIFLRGTNKSVITNNLVVNTMGIDSLINSGQAIPTSEVSRNIVQGRIRDRNGAVSVQKNNLVSADKTTFDSWFQNVSQFNYTYMNAMLMKDVVSPSSDVTKDMCGQDRLGNLDLGPFEFQNTACFQHIMQAIQENKK